MNQYKIFKLANFYRRFIQGKIAAPFTSMLRTSSATGSSDNLTPTAVVVDNEVDGGGVGAIVKKTAKSKPAKAKSFPSSDGNSKKMTRYDGELLAIIEDLY